MIRAANLQRQNLKRLQSTGLDMGLGQTYIPKAAPSPEHYHIIYHVPKDGLSIPHFKEVYTTSREAYVKIHEMAQEAEPNVEWYEDGQVGFETRLYGRADMWWLVLEVAACIRSACTKIMQKNAMRGKLILLPGR